MKEFLIENWQYVAAICFAALSTVFSTILIIKKSGGKISVWDAVKAVILEKIPSYIAIVEVDGHGEEKKNAVLNLALKEAAASLGRKLTNEETNAIIALASKQIETVLAAPQKKEIPEKPKSKYRV